MREPAVDAATVTSWLAAAASAPVVAALEAVYADVADEVQRRAPVCRASGECCRFDAYGHRLYVTGLEAAYALRRSSPLPDGPVHGNIRLTVLPGNGDVGAAGCRFQRGGLCTIHAVRPLGCRVYYCDPSAQDWQQELCERTLRDVRAIHQRFAVEYCYSEWRALLSWFDAAGAAIS